MLNYLTNKSFLLRAIFPDFRNLLLVLPQLRFKDVFHVRVLVCHHFRSDIIAMEAGSQGSH